MDEPFTNTCALMRAPDGTLISQFELHDLENLSLIKYDMLSVEAADKIQTCLELLIEQGYIEQKSTLRETYMSVLNPYVIERADHKMWEMVWNHDIVSLFQMEKQSGIQGIALTKPENVDELATLNSVIRLVSQEKGGETPLEKYTRFREHKDAFEKEMIENGLTEEERKILHRQLDISSGLCITQELFMSLVQLPECGEWDLQWADKLRKAIAKKNPKAYNELEEQFFKRVEEKHLSKKFCDYVWKKQIALSKGYGFNASHTLGYSIVALQEMNLAYKYPLIFWNTANLIVDSAGIDYSPDDEENVDEIAVSDDTDTTTDEADEEIVSIYEPEDWEGYEYEDLPDRSGKKKKKVKTVDYGKIATAIGRFKNFGITVAPPNINSSSFTFTPVVETNTILYGLRGIARISTDLVNEIISKRPFSSMTDFLSRININRLSMVNLIKCGAFDEIENKAREEIMDNYIASVSDHRDKLTLQNMNEIIQRELIPENMGYLKTLYNFNKVLKTHKTETYYIPGDQGIDFLVKHGCADDLIDGEKIPCKVWDKKYAKAMTPLKDYLKEHSDELVKELNATYFAETKKKYASGNISKWEMESLSFYSHPHELAAARRHFTNFFKLPEEPAIEKTFESKDGKSIPIYALTTIAGTVINRDKMKHTITLLTVDGVVNVKIYKSQFAVYDRQLSFIKKDGTKVVVEKSWFTRGNLLMIQGFRRGQDFVPKAYKNSPNPALTKINGIDEFGNIDYQKERLEVGDEE